MKDGVCKALDLPFAFIPLGGANDGAYLNGHSFTYEGSTICGIIIQKLMECQYMNPIIFFDELDKVSHTHKGDEIINTLVHLTDPVQNDKFSDKYFYDVEFDLSKCLIVFTFNDINKINPILRNRITTINIDKYNQNDKLSIVKNYMLPRMLDDFKLEKKNFDIDDETIRHLINVTEKEDGVRNIKRNLELIISTINLFAITDNNKIFNSKNITVKFPMNITKSIVDKIII